MISKSKKTKIILFLIVSGFFFKEFFLAGLFPMFTGQDETRHYNTIQYFSEPKEKNWTIEKISLEERDRDRIETYNFSEEIRQTAVAANLSILRQGSYNKQYFAEGNVGQGENEINSKKWKPINKYFPPDTTGASLYHRLGSLIEKFFSGQSILVRFFLIRLLSVILGTAFIFFSYLFIRETGFSEKSSLIITAIISFQPKISNYLVNINYDPLLIFSFAVFGWGGMMALKRGLNWKNVSVLLISMIIGIMTKGTALILVGVFIILVSYLVYNQIKNKKKAIVISLVLTVLLFLILNGRYNLISLLPFQKNISVHENVLVVAKYLSKSLPKAVSSSKNYWGNIDWLPNDWAEYFIKVIWAGEFLSLIGLGIFFFSKKTPEFLPSKKNIIFIIILLTALQIGIRIYDCQIFIITGKLELGTPGRYFLPNLTAHFILVSTGIGMLVKRKHIFDFSLIFLLILMFSFSMYIIFNVVLPRYYL